MNYPVIKKASYEELDACAELMEDGRMIGMINSSNITKYAMNACISATTIAK